MNTRTRPEYGQLNLGRLVIVRSFMIIFVCLHFGFATAIAQDTEKRDITMLQQWSGDYPVAELGRLPEGQEKARVGFMGDKVTFAAVWGAFKPGENLPDMDFSENIIVYTRNVTFYNRLTISKATLVHGVVEILSMETRSALPIEDKVAMAMVVIPRAGVIFFHVAPGTGVSLFPR